MLIVASHISQLYRQDKHFSNISRSLMLITDGNEPTWVINNTVLFCILRKGLVGFVLLRAKPVLQCSLNTEISLN